ncbi:anthranilate phosphoribosyltransferase [Kushneria phosphatilytica]|uniref:Anthranilate phosphoribosyltransferase n=1 Tax=Kushneria phosphatilytica TaxID=657387 RepID=A0A1S1NXL0_9GAMM|nr:anthranilate phosphoribosyltransferase [Kushneria phosphatilytica]OHV12300.1 anthranilate phosphoribosyltransferase [Kushneria phosphatilytica]QEL11506.1 anthranilate phosphoribosyltransferase [Kushneria phosphatilytica]
MELKDAIRVVHARRDLTLEEMRAVMSTIMSGEADPIQMGGFLMGLAMKGETADEITAAVQVMRELMHPVHVNVDPVVDIVGTGGDGMGLFNVSSAASFAAAACGAHVAKHGGRGVSSSSGSADLLARAGISLELDPSQIARCIEEVGVGFMFAPNHHTAMRHAVAVRRALGVRTMFNILGPLTNPTGATRQVLGVYDRSLVPLLAEALRQLGSRHVLVVHSADGLDEISLAAPTHVAELNNGHIEEYVITPEELGIERQPLSSLRADDTEQSLALVQSALAGKGPEADMIALNAGAALYAADLVGSIAEGVARVRESLSRGEALDRLHTLASFSASLLSGERR